MRVQTSLLFVVPLWLDNGRFFLYSINFIIPRIVLPAPLGLTHTSSLLNGQYSQVPLLRGPINRDFTHSIAMTAAEHESDF